MLAHILEAIEKVGNKVGSKVVNKLPNITDKQQIIINSMKINPKISATKLAEIVGIPKWKIEENIDNTKSKLKHTLIKANKP